jgi:hypothetical protein
MLNWRSVERQHGFSEVGRPYGKINPASVEFEIKSMNYYTYLAGEIP